MEYLSPYLSSNIISILGYSVLVTSFVGFLVGIFVTLQLYTYFFPKRSTFSNTAIVITGAGGALGRQLAIFFSKSAPLILLDISKQGLETTEAALKNLSIQDPTYNPVALSFICDITDPKEVHSVLTKARNQLKLPIRIVINNAGIVIGKDIDDLSTTEIIRAFDVNILGTYNIIKETLPDMKDQKDGCIVTVASLMGLVGSARLSEYCMTKWGLVGLMESLRLELGRDNYYNSIDTVTVCPYHISTSAMFSGIFEAAEDYNPIRSLCYPSLRDRDVAKSIFSAVQQGGHHYLVLPLSFYYIAYLSRLLLPLRFFDNFVGWFGGWHGMSSFTGARDHTSNSTINHTKHLHQPTKIVDTNEDNDNTSFLSRLPIALVGNNSSETKKGSNNDKSPKSISNNTVVFADSLPMMRMSSLQAENENNNTAPETTSSVRMRRLSVNNNENIPTRITSIMNGPSGTYKAREWGLKK